MLYALPLNLIIISFAISAFGVRIKKRVLTSEKSEFDRKTSVPLVFVTCAHVLSTTTSLFSGKPSESFACSNFIISIFCQSSQD